MSEQENPLDSAEGLAAMLGLVVVHLGGEVRVPAQLVRDGFEAGQRTTVDFDADKDELVVRVTSAS